MMISPEQLTEMIALCRQGRPEGYNRLIESYGPRLLSYFKQVSANPTDAEDALQEFFVKFIKAIDTYRHQQRFEHWLFRIAANLARDRARAANRRIKPLSLHPTGTEMTEKNILQEPESAGPLPDQHLQHAEMADQLHGALAALTETDREMILLRHYGDLSFKEIAQHFNLPLGTVLCRVHRGLKHLRKILDHEYKPAQ